MRRLFLVFLLLWPAFGARANDGVAGLVAGELVLERSDAIEMAEEDLYLSLEQVRLRYLFRNHSDSDVTTLVMFPLPPIDMGQETDYGFTQAHRDPDDPVGFRLWIDGQPAPVSSRARAFSPEGRDVTALLEKWQVPLIFLTPDEAAWRRLQDRLEGLPPAALDELAAAGAIGREDWMADGFYPLWTTHFAYYWKMAFPAGRDVEVRHEYVPVPEAFILSAGELEAGFMADEACTDAAFLAGVRRKLGPDEYAATTGYLLRYFLTTANSWRGPIGRFHLIVDKGRPDMLVSLCRDGIVKTGPTTFEWQAENWVPRRDLSLLFVAPPH